MLLRCRFLPAALLCFLLVAPTTAAADSVTFSSFRLSSDGGVSTIQFVGSDAAFESVLFLASPTEQGPFFPNHSTLPGLTASLGSFDPGAELVFGLRVLSTGDEFFTGPASRNPDGVAHARARRWSGTPTIPTPGVLIGFEDLFGGGDRDFNDYQFVVSNVSLVSATVPEPGTMLLLGTGIAVVARRALKRRRE